ncbi:MAG: transposase [Parasutterella sp.]
MSVPGIGPITATRLKATIGDIQRFEKPKSIVAYYGLVPKSKATGHNEKRRHNSSRRSSCPFSSDREVRE